MDLPGSSRMILGGQLGEFHSQLFYPAGILSPERVLSAGSDIGLHTGMYLEQARAITADLGSGGLVWHGPQDETRMKFIREMLNDRSGYFNVNGTPSHPMNSVRLEPTDLRNRVAGELMAETPWSRTVDNPNNGLRGEQFNVSEMMVNRMLKKAMTPNPLVVTEGPSDVLERGPAGWVPRHPTPGASRPDTDESVRDVVFAVQREVPWPMPGMGTYTNAGVPLSSAIFTPPQNLIELTKRERKKQAMVKYRLRQRPLPAAQAPPIAISGVNRQTGEIREGQLYDPNSVPRMSGSGKPGVFSAKAHAHGLEPTEFARAVLKDPKKHDPDTISHARELDGIDRMDKSDHRVTGGALGDMPDHHAEGQKGAGDMAGSEAVQDAHRNRHLQFGDMTEKAKLPAPIDPGNLPAAPKDDAEPAQGGQSSAPAHFVAEQTAMTRQTLMRARGAEVAASVPLGESNERWTDWMKGQSLMPGARPTVGPPSKPSAPLEGGALSGGAFKGERRDGESESAFARRKAAYESAQTGKKSDIDANDEDAHDRAQNAYRKTDEYKKKNAEEADQVQEHRMSKIREFENRPDQQFIRGLGEKGLNAISSAGKSLGLGDNVGDKVREQFKSGGIADKAARGIRHGINEAGRAVGLGDVADNTCKAATKGLHEAGKIGNEAFKAVKGRDFKASDLSGSGMFKGEQRDHESDAAFAKRKAAFESAQTGKKSDIDANDEDAHDRAQNAYRKTDEYKKKNAEEDAQVQEHRMSKIREYENRPDMQFIRGLGDLGKKAITSVGKTLGLGDDVGEKVVGQFGKGGVAYKAAHAIKEGVNEAGKAAGLGNVADEAGKAMDKGFGAAGKVGNEAFKAVKGRDFKASDTADVLGAAGQAVKAVSGSGYPPALVELLLKREEKRANKKAAKRGREQISTSGLA